MLLEAVLLLGLVEEGLEEWLLSYTALPAPVRVLAAMTLSLGLLGGMAVLVRKHLASGLQVTEKAVRRLPVPLPRIALHGALLTAIFLGYAWVWNDDADAVGEIVAWMSTLGAGVAEAIAGP